MNGGYGDTLTILKGVAAVPTRVLHRDPVAQPGLLNMSIESRERHHSAAPLTSRVQRGATATEIAIVMAALCQEINASLSPILGLRGVDALHNRNHHACATSHRWMASLCDAQASCSGCEALVALLKQREPSEALSCGEAYLQTFHDLLLSLIGPSLTERLLHNIWPSNSSGNPAQDTPQ